MKNPTAQINGTLTAIWVVPNERDYHSDDQKPERILIKVYSTQAEYVNALPIHESQKEIEKTDEWSIFEYRLVPCFNFYQQLLWHRERLEVLEPLHVRDEMKKTIEKMLEHYSTQRKP